MDRMLSLQQMDLDLLHLKQLKKDRKNVNTNIRNRVIWFSIFNK